MVYFKILLSTLLLFTTACLGGGGSSGSATSPSNPSTPGTTPTTPSTPTPGPTGVIDTSFNSVGYSSFQSTVSSTPKTSVSYKIMEDHSGRILLLLNVINGSDRYCEVRRFTSNGVIDNTYNGTGFYQKADFLGYNSCNPLDMLVTSSNEVYVLADVQSTAGGGRTAVIFKLTENGSLDGTYGTSGHYVCPGNSKYTKNAKLYWGQSGVVFKTGSPTTTTVGFVSKFDTSVAIDSSFGSAGTVSIDAVFNPSENDIVNYVYHRSDGKIEISGWATSGYFIGRLNSDGSVDSTYGTSGFNKMTMTPAQQHIHTRPLPNGGLVSGYIKYPDDTMIFIDSTYTTATQKLFPNITGDSSNHAIEALDVHSNGTVYAVTDNWTESKFAVYSVTSAGSYNQDFGSLGILNITDINGDSTTDTLGYPKMTIASDNSLLVAVSERGSSPNYIYITKIK